MIAASPPPTAAPRAARRGSAAGATGNAAPGAVVVGAGLAGLAAAARLHAAGVPVTVLESSDGVGGRVRTDQLDGFLLDRGFQILITAYPEARRLLDYDALRLRRFYSGALVHTGGGKFHRLADPLRHPLDGLLSLLNPVGTPVDKLRVGLARLRAAASSDSAILTSPEQPILARLQADSFSPSIIDQFFRPFFGGVFFDRDLATTSRLLDFVFKCLALGDNALPAAGIGAIPAQLAGRLPAGALRLEAKVRALEPKTVRTDAGDLRAELGVVLAVPAPEAARLLGRAPPARPPRGTTCLYFAAERPAVRGPMLLLNGTGRGRVNNMFFASEVAPEYAPEGKTLVSVSLIGAAAEGGEGLEGEVVRELGEWFGEREVEGWRHLRSYSIEYAQPDQAPPTELVGREVRAGEGLYLCGDYMQSATFDGALVSGRLAAEALLQDLSRVRSGD